MRTDSEGISERNALAMLAISHKKEKEKEVQEKEKEKAPAKKPAGTHTHKPQKVPLPEGFAISDRVEKWAADKGYSLLPARFEQFVGKAKQMGYAYADWDEAFMEAVRKDWAGLNQQPASSVQNWRKGL